jgi:site-specific DNA-methyltransferase (adenine-specific)
MKLNKIYWGDSRKMDEIEDNCVHLTVTSPPYYVGKNYESYLPTLDSYFQMLYDVFTEVHRVTIPGGKIIVNIGDIAVGSNHNEGFPEEIMVISKLVDFMHDLGSYLYARIIWEKDDPWANSSHVSFHRKIQHAEYRILPAWEYVFVFRKGKEARKDKSVADGRWITKNEWKKLVHGVWNIRSVQSNKFHAAMFPEKLVFNCIKLYSFPGDVVLDPFMGSGVTAVVAKKMGRKYLGYELEPLYVRLIERKLDSVSTDESAIFEYRDKTMNAELQERFI